MTLDAFTSSTTWECPTGVTSVTVRCWAGGGGGGATSSNDESGGGAGGQYAESVISVTPGVTYTVTVGGGGLGATSGTADGGVGGDTWFSTSGTVIAKGGVGGGGGESGAGGVGSTTGGIGNVVVRRGGSGGPGQTSTGGGGGGGAGSSAQGGDASGGTGGAGGSGQGGAGANGGSANGLAGSIYGGAGSGAETGFSGSNDGGNGAGGRLELEYTVSADVLTAVAPTATADINGSTEEPPPAVTFRSVGAESETAAGGSIAVATPVGFEVGDLLLTFITQDNNDYPTAPAGWTLLGQTTNRTSSSGGPYGAHSIVFYRVADGTEGASEAFSCSTSAYPAGDGYTTLRMMALAGIDPAAPIVGGEWSNSTTTATTAELTHPSVTPTVAGSALVLFRSTASDDRAYTSSVTSASPAGVQRIDDAYLPDGPPGSNSVVYVRDGGFTLEAQSFTTTASGTLSDGSVVWSIIVRAPEVVVTTQDSVGILIG